MKKGIVWALFGLLLSVPGFAQNVAVKISVKNEKNIALTNATVQVLRVPDSALYLVKTLKTDDVYFSLQQHTSYFLKITSVEIMDNISILKTGSTDTIINIVVATRQKNLQTVTVSATKPLIKQEDDKTIVDAEVLANSSSNALEVLEKTPGVIVDQDGNVLLNSGTPALVYINGREVKLGASEIASLLKNLPANSVSKIEILRTPSAKFDADASGGIVNIVLKKGIKPGVNGTVDAAHFQGKLGTNSIGFSINKTEKKLSTYLSANITQRTNFDVLNSDRLLPDAHFLQYAYTKFRTTSGYAGGGFGYQLNSKWSMAYDARLSTGKNKSSIENDIDIVKISWPATTGQNISIINNSSPFVNFTNTLSLKHKIDSIGSEWTQALDYNYFNSTNNQVYNNIFIVPQKNVLNGDGSTRNNKNIFGYKTDVVVKTKAGYTVETGVKLNASISKNNAAYFADTSTGRYAEKFQTNRFRYKEAIGAAYLQVSKKIKGFTIKPGLRLEYTNINGHQLFPADTVFKIKRTDLFPYLYLRHDIAKIAGFKLIGNAIFRRSITRPFYEALNPYPKYADQYTFDVGNPALQPQFTTNYEFNITANEFPFFSAGLNDIKNIFTSLTYSSGDTLFRTYDNLGSNKEVYVRLVAGIPPGKKYFFYLGTQFNHVNFKGLYSNVPFTFKKSTFTFFTNHNYKATPTLNLSLNGFMRVNAVGNFFVLKPFGGLNLSANKSLLKKKMNIIFSVNDLFYTGKNRFAINVPNFIATGKRYNDNRRAGITVKYNFGGKPREERLPAYGAPVEGQ